MPSFSAEAQIMPKGDFLREALSNSHRGPHHTSVIRSAIRKEMNRYTAKGPLPEILDVGAICCFLAPLNQALTASNEEQLLAFADFLSRVDADPSLKPTYQLKGALITADLGM